MTVRLTWIVGLLSAALLGFELSLMRILSYAQWYHFAYMVISVALLGFGASGTLLSVFRSAFIRQGSTAIAVTASLCSVSLVCAPWLLSQIQLDPFLMIWEPGRLWTLIPFYLVVFLPFFFGAVVLGLSFILFPDRVGTLYAGNLMGSGIGSLSVVMLTEWIHPSDLPYLLALITLPALLLAAADLRRMRTLLVGVPLLVVVVVWLLPRDELERSQYKSLSKALLLPDARIAHRKVGPLGVLETVESRSLRYAPGMSLLYPGMIPSQVGVFSDGEWVGSILDVRDTAAIDMLRSSLSALPYQLVKEPRVLVLGSGTGSDLQFAIASGARSVNGVELNKDLVALLSESYRAETGDLVHDARVTLGVEEARSFLSRSHENSDIIVVPILEGWTASAAGACALLENYLYTLESFQTMLDRLSEEGVVVIHSWMTFPPRSPAKLIGMVFEVLKARGVKNPESHVVAVRSWNAVSIMVKKRALTEAESDVVRRFCDERGFDVIALPGIRPHEVNRFHVLNPEYLYEATVAISRGEEQAFRSRYPFSIESATDDRPYFFHFLKWSRIPELAETYGPTEATFFELGSVLLLATFVQLALLSFVLIVLPLLLKRIDRPRRAHVPKTILFFGSIGFGYMFVEMVMIQKFILFLGHPVYSASVIITTLLVCSGAGSWFSNRLKVGSLKLLRIVLAGIVFLLLAYAVFLTPLLLALLWLPFPARILLCTLLLAPLAFLMGLPFPLGVMQASAENNRLIPYAWGVNGYSSVMGASLAVLIAMEFGFLALFSCSVLMYGLAALASLRVHQVDPIPIPGALDL